MRLNNYSKQITSFNDTTVGRHYTFYNNKLVAFGDNHVFSVEREAFRKKSVVDYTENTYAYKFKGARMIECFNLNNMLTEGGGIMTPEEKAEVRRQKRAERNRAKMNNEADFIEYCYRRIEYAVRSYNIEQGDFDNRVYVLLQQGLRHYCKNRGGKRALL
ncbi:MULTISPECIES: hypothetical protein [Bacillus cereus group]|uniref:Uncharacterized protein n=2 Tax=Bacillus cereus group TaxID=86661 RepID=R8Q1F6_BACCE|nr:MULTISPECIES: hypothetical protein [Bacillus cereus group]EOP64642.1 hypothetical protein IIQ_03359 [Bacillus cereus VD118]MCQ6358302.1 hypothetical protein [Bacillus cereus]SCB70440.1 Uncharacterized protein BWGO95_04610 [Bacillus mycoides]